jgi:Hypothetical glycosyl hydrolase family 15
VETSRDGGRRWKRRRVATVSSLVLLTRADGPSTTATSTTTTSTTTVTVASATTTTTSRSPSTTNPALTPTTAPRSTSTTTKPVTTTTRGATTTTSTLPSSAAGDGPHASGYIARYDSGTIAVWPKRLNLILGEADAEGPLLADARRLAAAAGNSRVKFIFYISLTDLDSQCRCLDSKFYDSFIGDHPEWILRDASGAKISTHNGFGRVFTTDIGNPAYVDAWADWVLAGIDRWGWDGVFADNIFRGYFGEWSAPPINPRTGSPYTTEEYRRDMLAALRRLTSRFHARGKIVVGNHSSAYDAATFADQTIKDQVTTMDGVEMEDCVYDSNGNRQAEAIWISQLQYLDFANRNGVRTLCKGAAGSIGDPVKRWYVLATDLLVAAGDSSVAELNGVDEWWDGLDYDLGVPRGE